MASVLFLSCWGVLMGPIQYRKPASRTPKPYLTLACLPRPRSPASDIWSEASVHRSLFWEHRVDPLLLTRGKSLPLPTVLHTTPVSPGPAGISQDPGPLTTPTHTPPRTPPLSISLFTVLTKRPRDLAAQYDAHIHCGGRAASLPALVHCVVFPHGHHGPAICGALWRRPCCRVDERLNVGIRQRGRILWAVKLYIGGQVDETRRDMDARLRQGICVLGRTTEHVPPRISSHSCVLRNVFVPSLVTMLRHAPHFPSLPAQLSLDEQGQRVETEGKMRSHAPT
jgi:hypothetical protein